MNHRLRLIIIAVFIFAWAGLLYSRLFSLQISRHEEFSQKARQQHLRRIELTPKRGTIHDRNGKILAININTPSVYVDPAEIEDPGRVISAAVDILGLDESDVREAVESGGRFVWLKRKAAQEEWDELEKLELKGVNAVTESKRLYPGSSLASHVLGFVNVDNKGQAGVEYSYDSYLRGQPGVMLSIRGAKHGYQFSEGTVLKEPTGGNDIYLTLDSRIQQIVEEELAAHLQLTGAQSATVIVMDPYNGEIHALANMPDFDPNSRFTATQRFARKNRAVVDAYEPGSTFKIITAAAAFERGVVSPEDTFDCQMGSITIGSRTIRDHHPFGVLSFREIIEHSSNVGTIKVAGILGEKPLWDMARRFGYGSGTGIDLPGENPGILRPVERWSPNSYGSISIGQEVSGNPVQISLNAAVIANGGYWVRPHVLLKIERSGEKGPLVPEIEKRKIVEDDVVQTLQELMQGVVSNGGGERAQVEGIAVAGKTGTGEIAQPGKGYVEGEYLSSFVGFLPAERPRFAILCTIYKPVGPYYGGQVGAPLFKKIAERMVSLLNIPRTSQRQLALDSSGVMEELTRTVSVRRESLSPRSLPDLEGALLMPDVTGLPMREALHSLASLGVVPEVRGGGVVVSQSPAAGAKISGAVVLTGGGTEIAGR